MPETVKPISLDALAGPKPDLPAGPKPDALQDPAKLADGVFSNVHSQSQRFIADILTPKPVVQYRPDDYPTIRKLLFQNVKDAVSKRFPLANDRYTLSVEDVDYDDPEDVDLEEQKKAMMEDRTLQRRLRGVWVMRNAADGKEVSRSGRTTLMQVPYMTDRGTFIRNGTEYAFGNIMRLEPGVYTKQKDDEITAQFNIKKGTGAGFNLRFIPATGIFQVNRGTVNCPAYPIFRDLGVTDDQMKEAWGEELFARNREAGMNEKAKQSAGKIYNM